MKYDKRSYSMRELKRMFKLIKSSLNTANYSILFEQRILNICLMILLKEYSNFYSKEAIVL